MGKTMSAKDDLLSQAQRFDIDALSQIYDQYRPALYRYAFRLLGESDLAEECVAETFSRFLLALRRGGGPSEHLQAYLYRVAHNWVVDHWRQQPPPSVSLDDDLCEDPSTGHDDDPAEAARQHIDATHIRAALRLLTPDQRQVILLKYLEAWDNSHIAATLGKPVSAIKALHSRALATLRRLLFKDGEKFHEPA
jgi:RNA polymerase sigma-70 factor (ECF subfamily)